MAGVARVVVKATNEARGGFDQAASDAENFQRRVTQASALATVGLVGLGAAALKIGADFEHGMDQVGAVAGATAQQMDLLTQKAKTIGAETAFSASQAAGAMEELAAAGLNVEQILNGGADAAVSLAAAGGTTLPNAARIAATSMSVWRMEGSQMTDVVNRLAAAANLSTFDVDDMGQAIAQGGAVAELSGVSFQDFATAVMATATAFSSGSDAGTSFKTFVTALPGNSNQAKDAIRELGLEFYTSSGNLKDMADIVQELHDKLGPLSEQQQTVYLKTIFGNDAFRTAAGLMKLTGDEFEAMSKKAENTSAMDIAAQRMGNTKGSIEELKGSLETLAISFSEKLLPAVAGAAEGATEAVNAFGALPDSTQGLALGFTAVAVAAPAAVSMIEKAGKAAVLLGTGAGSAQLKVAALATGLGVLAVATDALLEGTTGAGLIERIFGDPAKAAAAEDASKMLARELANMGDESARVTETMRFLESTMDNYRVAGGAALDDTNAFASAIGGADHRVFGFNVGLSDGKDKLAEFEAQVRVATEAMLLNAASGQQMWEAYRQLPPELQAVMLEVAGVDEKIRGFAESVRDLNGGEFEEKLDALAAGFRAVQTDTEGTMTAFDHWILSMEDGADVADELSDALERLTGHLAGANPQYQENAVQIAIWKEELADLEGKTGEMTETEKERAAALESSIALLEQQNGAMDTNRETVDTLVKAVADYNAEAGFNLATTLANSTLAFEDQVEAAGQAGLAFAKLSNEDVPGAIEAFNTLVITAPEAAKAVGPAFVSQLNNSVADPAAYAHITAWLEQQGVYMGQAVTDGMAAGIASNSGVAATAAFNAAAGVAEAARRALQVESPSKVFKAIGFDVTAGLAQGIEEGTPAALAAMNGLVNGLVQVGDNIHWDPVTRDFVVNPHLQDAKTDMGNGVYWDPVLKDFVYDPEAVLAGMPESAQEAFGGKAPTAYSTEAYANNPNPGVDAIYQQLLSMPAYLQDKYLKDNPWAAKVLQGHGYDLNIGTGMGVTAPSTGAYHGGAFNPGQTGIGKWGQVTTEQGLNAWDAASWEAFLADKGSVNQMMLSGWLSGGEVGPGLREYMQMLAATGGKGGASMSGWAPNVQQAYKDWLPLGQMQDMAGQNRYGAGNQGMGTSTISEEQLWFRMAIDTGLTVEEASALIASGLWRHAPMGWDAYGGNTAEQALMNARMLLQNGGPAGAGYKGGDYRFKVRTPAGGNARPAPGGGGGGGDWGGKTTVIVNSPIMTAGALRGVAPEIEESRRLEMSRSFVAWGRA